MRRRRRARSLVALVLLSAASPSGARAGDALDPLLHGALAYHGNHCGPGNTGARRAPVDALDDACMRHDACTTRYVVQACGCDARPARACRPAAEPRPDAAWTAMGRGAAPGETRGAALYEHRVAAPA